MFRRLSVFLFWSILWLSLSFWVNTFYFLWRHTPPLKVREPAIETPSEVISTILNRPTFKVTQPGDVWVQGLAEPYAILPVGVTDTPGVTEYVFVVDVRQWQSAGFLYRIPVRGKEMRDIFIEPRSPLCASAKPTEVCVAGTGKGKKGLSFPVALARSGRKIYVLELSGSPALWEFDTQAQSLKSVSSFKSLPNSEFKDIVGWRDGWAIADRGGGLVRVYSESWNPISTLSRDVRGSRFAPNALAVDSSGNLIVADVHSGQISVFSPEGTFLKDFGGYGAQEEGKFLRPTSIAISPAGNLFITDTYRNIVNVFTSEGEYMGAIRPDDFKRKPLVQPRGIALSTDQSFFYISGGKRGEGGYIWLLPLPEEEGK